MLLSKYVFVSVSRHKMTNAFIGGTELISLAADSADINTRLQLIDTDTMPPMHGGILSRYVFF